MHRIRKPDRSDQDIDEPVAIEVIRCTPAGKLSDTHPGDGFEPVPGGLEDVYFSTLSASRRAA
jgi:hypothetical protein